MRLHLLALAVWFCMPAAAQGFQVASEAVLWEQVDKQPSFIVHAEREQFDTRDRTGRFICAVQIGNTWPKLEELSARWQVVSGDNLVAQDTAPIAKGLVAVSFDLSKLAPGRYDITADLIHGDRVLQSARSFFRYVSASTPAQAGRVALNLPRGVPLATGTYPVTAGVPFPKGAFWNANNVRVVTANGTPVPSQVTVRSRWGHRPDSSIRWLGVDFQAAPAPAWWPKREDTRYFLEFGPQVQPPVATDKLTVTPDRDGIEINTGPLQFLVRRDGFNLVDNVRLNGKEVLAPTPRHGLYLVDHEGAIYRAANDTQVKLIVEEQGPLRVVLRAEGWYVKDGTNGRVHSYKLPTDKLCKFVTRIEAYAGKPYVRVLSTWINTFDTFNVRLRDVGISLPLQNATQAHFGVEESTPLRQAVNGGGVRLVQHLPHEFTVEDSKSTPLAKGKHSAGWALAETSGGLVGIGHRETWQRFPKELEVAPGSIKLHVWPAHSKEHPQINQVADNEIHKLWFAHQGRELDMQMPWNYYLKIAKQTGSESQGTYTAAGLALAGVHSSGMGTAITSDLLLQFATPQDMNEARQVAACFQAAPHAMPDTKWLCDSLAIGYVHPYDPARMNDLESIIEETSRGYAETQDATDEYGMWIYRTWHHNDYDGNGKWEPYRLYNAAHHYDPFMPWLFYARSGDPFYLSQGMANIRMLSDVQVNHYNDPEYPHREFHSGQARLVGSMKHTNGFNTWGGDHGVLAHLTCYNALILAHYLTGDLRLREVLVDEWQQTIVADRKNPEYPLATRLYPGRDNNNALGEVIDLYQMTYHPALLAHMASLLKTYPQNMKHWGQAMHNVLLFHGSEDAKQKLLDGVRDYLATNGKPVDPNKLWDTIGASRHEYFALASILEPDSNFHAVAYRDTDPIARQLWAAKVREQEPGAAAFGLVPDYLLYLPRVMYALDKAGESGGQTTVAQMAKTQALPSTSGSPATTFTRVIIREDQDQEFDVTINGYIGEGGMPVQIFAPDSRKVVDVVVPAGIRLPHKITVPRDNVSGQYVIFLRARDGKESLRAPLTTLPGEVYFQPKGTIWQQGTPTRLFTRASGASPETIELQPYSNSARIEAHGSGQVLGEVNNAGLEIPKQQPVKAEIGPNGAWLVTNSRYVTTRTSVILSLTPKKWFQPEASRLNLTPSVVAQ